MVDGLSPLDDEAYPHRLTPEGKKCIFGGEFVLGSSL